MIGCWTQSSNKEPSNHREGLWNRPQKNQKNQEPWECNSEGNRIKNVINAMRSRWVQLTEQTAAVREKHPRPVTSTDWLNSGSTGRKQLNLNKQTKQYHPLENLMQHAKEIRARNFHTNFEWSIINIQKIPNQNNPNTSMDYENNHTDHLLFHLLSF